MRLVSSASSQLIGGRIVGSRRASMVLPVPGGPTMKTLWPPAAATSRARLACACPWTSEKSASCPGTWPIQRDTSTSTRSSPPSRNPSTTWARLSAGWTANPWTTAASSAFSRGTHTASTPRLRASMAMGSTPRTGRTDPSSESSPRNSVRSRFLSPEAGSEARMTRAMGRSKAAPSFFTSAGARLTVIRWGGKEYPELRMAAFTRSLLSLTALSGSPTTEKEGSARAMSTSTSTRYASTPKTAPETILDSTASPPLRPAATKL